MKYEIDKKMFSDESSLVARYKLAEGSAAKFNIKVRAADLSLMKKVADMTDRTRAFILNDIVENILVRMLLHLYNDDKPSAAVLAAYVDTKCGKSDQLDGWVAQLPGAVVISSDLTLREAGTSDKSSEILRRIKAAKK
jgi:hypothetical protein